MMNMLQCGRGRRVLEISTEGASGTTGVMSSYDEDCGAGFSTRLVAVMETLGFEMVKVNVGLRVRNLRRPRFEVDMTDVPRATARGS